MEGCAVRSTSTPKLCALTLAMALGFAVAGYAQDAPANGQKAEPPPVPDRGTTAQPNCIDESSKYTKRGKSLFSVMKLTNKCEARIKCAVFVYKINARGAAQGRATLILGPKSDGAAATKSYALKVKGAGGFSTSDRECQVF
jgi:hypothetical protein